MDQSTTFDVMDVTGEEVPPPSKSLAEAEVPSTPYDSTQVPSNQMRHYDDNDQMWRTHFKNEHQYHTFLSLPIKESDRIKLMTKLQQEDAAKNRTQ